MTSTSKYIIFIDTNIILDFYRIRKSDVNLAYLDTLYEIRNDIITTSQIEMEYKKNRQIVILETLNQFGKSDDEKNLIPALLGQYKPVKMYEKKRQEAKTQQKKIKEKILKIFENPTQNDPVYNIMNKIFKTTSPLNLDRSNLKRLEVRRLARKRFSLGYPPRKDKDTSYGDSINWEWIIQCANTCTQDIILVTRDSDYGTTFSDKSYLNDWLKKEFSERVSRKRKIFYTQKLSEALKLMKQKVSPAMIEEENRIISEKSIASYYTPNTQMQIGVPKDPSNMSLDEILAYIINK